MIVLTMRYQQGHFVVSGPDIEPINFKTRGEARDWRRSIPIERPKADREDGDRG